MSAVNLLSSLKDKPTENSQSNGFNQSGKYIGNNHILNIFKSTCALTAIVLVKLKKFQLLLLPSNLDVLIRVLYDSLVTILLDKE